MEQARQPYLSTQHSQHRLCRLRHQFDQSRGTQELQVLLHMVEPSVRLFSLSSSPHFQMLMSLTVLAQPPPFPVSLSLNSQRAASAC